MPDVMAEYFVNQEMSGLLIEMVSSGSIETKIEFARRVHVRFTRRDLVDLTLLYRIQQLSDEQIPYLLQLLMQDADYRKQNNPDEYVYGENWLPVQTLRLEVLRSLSERLINLDPVVVAAYYELYNSLNESQGVRKDAQTAEYRKFLLRLKSGFFPDQCESKLQIVF